MAVHFRLGGPQSDLLSTPTSPQVIPCQNKSASGFINASYSIGLLFAISQLLDFVDGLFDLALTYCP